MASAGLSMAPSTMGPDLAAYGATLGRVGDVVANTTGPPIKMSLVLHMAITPNGRALYVTNGGDDTVTAINTATDRADPPIEIGDYAAHLVVAPDGEAVYVETASGIVVSVNTATNKVNLIGALPENPDATNFLAITPNGKTLYMGTSGPGRVSSISPATEKPGPAINVANPATMAFPPGTRTAYVVNTKGTVVPVNTANNVAGRPIDVGKYPSYVAVAPNGKTIYVVNTESNTLTPITTATNRAGPPIAVEPPNAGTPLSAIAITPNGRTIYVANLSTDTVTPISTLSKKAGRPIKVGGQPDAIAITPNGKTAYVTNSYGAGTVTPISTATNTAGSPIKVGGLHSDPDAIIITPNGQTAYVLCKGDNAIVPIHI